MPKFEKRPEIQAIAIKKIISNSLKNIDNIEKAAKEAPHIVKEWKKTLLHHTQKARLNLQKAEKSKDSKEVIRQFKLGTDQINIASKLLASSMTEAEKYYKETRRDLAIAGGAILLATTAMTAAHYLAAAEAAKVGAITAPLARQLVSFSNEISRARVPHGKVYRVAVEAANALKATGQAVLKNLPSKAIIKSADKSIAAVRAYGTEAELPKGTYKCIEEVLVLIKEMYK